MLRKVWSFILLVVGAVVAAMFAVGDTDLESDGKSVTLTATADVIAKRLAIINGWVGVATRTVESGDMVSLDISTREYQLQVPAAFNPAVGAIIWINPADITGHNIDDTSYTTTAADGLIALMKVTQAKNASNVLTGILFPSQLPELALN